MSRVTNIILITTSDEAEGGVERLNNALAAMAIVGAFERVDEHAGGPKAIEAAVFMAAFNHLNIESFRQAVIKNQWDFPESVQLFIKEQEDERFREIRLFTA
jgi:hypothetical protein